MKMKWMLLLMMMYLATVGKAQVRSMPNTQKDYYLYSSIEVRWADKANGEQCFVILMSPGENGQQRSSIMKTQDGRAIVVRNMMEGLAYLEVNGWELFEPRESIGKWIVRKKIPFEELKKMVDANTTYETIIPKVQLNLNEQTMKIDYK